MATLAASGWPNLADWANTHHPDGSILQMTDILSERNDVLDDIPWVESNLPNGHVIGQTANALPSGGWRQINAGTPRTKTEYKQVIEAVGILEDNSEVDVRLAEINGDQAAYRAVIDDGKVEGLGQQFADALFYESTTSNPDRVHGLTPRYPGTSGFTASAYTTAGTNAGSNCHSIWLITWAPRFVYGIFPKGTMAGLSIEDMGKQRIEDGSGDPYYAWCTNLVWRVGIAVEDFRYCVRHQWDPDDPAYADDDRGMYLAMQAMKNTIFKVTPQTRYYMNRTSKALLDAQLLSNEARPLTYLSPQGNSGQEIPAFENVPIRINDSLVAETFIT